jgi:hypothetical protein
VGPKPCFNPAPRCLAPCSVLPPYCLGSTTIASSSPVAHQRAPIGRRWRVRVGEGSRDEGEIHSGRGGGHRKRLKDLLLAAGAELVHVLRLPDFDRAKRIGEFWGISTRRPRTSGELLIDLEEDTFAE